LLQELIDQRGLAMIDMGDNGDIAESLDTGHWIAGGPGEESNATGINGNENNNDFDTFGAVYLY
jgi:hypothetical protein